MEELGSALGSGFSSALGKYSTGLVSRLVEDKAISHSLDGFSFSKDAFTFEDTTFFQENTRYDNDEDDNNNDVGPDMFAMDVDNDAAAAQDFFISDEAVNEDYDGNMMGGVGCED